MSKHRFMDEVLGTLGGSALKKAEERMPELESAILPRCVVSWVQAYSDGFKGVIPGTDSVLSFKKNQDDSYDGTLDYKGYDFSFDNASEYYVVACVVTALGETKEVAQDARAVDLARLGKSIDMMVKKAKQECEGRTAARVVQGLRKAAKRHHKPLDEAAGRGALAGALEPKGAIAPTDSQPMQPKTPIPKKSLIPTVKPAKPKSSFTLKLSEKEANRKCSACGQPQAKAGVLVGCLCFRELMKSTKCSFGGNLYTIQVGAEWGTDEIATYLETVKHE